MSRTKEPLRPRVPPRFLTRQHHNSHEVRVYEAARSHVSEHGKPPSVRHLGEVLGLNYVTIFRHLEDLERKGMVKRVVHGRLTVSMEFPMEPTT